MTITIYGKIDLGPSKDPTPGTRLKYSFDPREKYPVLPIGEFKPAPDVWPYSFVVEVPESAKLQQFGNDRKLEFEGKELSAKNVHNWARENYKGFSILEEHTDETLANAASP